MNTVRLDPSVVELDSPLSEGSQGSPTFQARVRLYMVVLLGVTVFLQVVFALAPVVFSGRALRTVVGNADGARRLLLTLGCVALVLAVYLRPFSRRGLLWLDGGAALLVSGFLLVGMPARPPELRPELSALLMMALVLFGRAALVPSSAGRTLFVGLLGLLPLFVVAPLLRPVDKSLAGIPLREMMRVTTFGFGVATLAVTAVTSHVIYKLRRSVRDASKLGPYVIKWKLGEGGMGVVYEAQHARLRRRTALKLIKPSRIDPTSEIQFELEARLTSELSHPNTVALYDYGKTADGIYYYAMEYIDGITLQDLVRGEGPAPAGRAVWLLRQVAASLAHAHARGLIHCDIKPSNVMLCDREGHPDCVKVLDFGLARRLRSFDGDGRGLYDGLVAGTPEFMAPEAVTDAASISAAADVYAVGVLGYFLLTGSVPFEGRDIFDVAYAHITEPPLPPSLRTDADVPRDLERVIMTCLAKDPARRYADGSALLRALEACAGGSAWSSEDAHTWWRTRGQRGPRPRVVGVRTAEWPTAKG